MIATAPITAGPRKDAWTSWSWLPLAFIWLLMLITFSVPGRVGPSTLGGLDLIALAKLGVRAGGIAALGLLIVTVWHEPRRGVVFWAATPFLLFSAWAVLSASWSPLQAVSLGQVAGHLVCLMVALVIGILYQGRLTASSVLLHLVLGLFVISAVLVGVNRFVSSDLSGLDRTVYSETEGAYAGLYHATAAGSTGSLGLLLLVSCRLLWGWRWTRILLVPGLVVFSALVYLAASRMAVALTVLLGAVAFIVLIPTWLRAGLVLATAVVGALCLTLDPGLVLSEEVYQKVQAYMERGESAERLSTFTGRKDMWEAMWQSYQRAPLMGHGYFVSSRTGSLDVWTGHANWTAHNILLQVLVSTGLIGAVLFLWGLGRLALSIGKDVGRRQEWQLTFFLGLMGIWYLGWGLMNEAFMGPLRPESVVFFSVLGLGLGQLIPASVPTPPGLPLARGGWGGSTAGGTS